MPALFIKITTKLGLVAPVQYTRLTQEHKDSICNGAGPKRWGWLVPDTMYGLSITAAANIHDYMYYVMSVTPASKWAYNQKVADELFYANMCTLINEKGGWLRRPRLTRAWLYYKAVSSFGGAFH